MKTEENILTKKVKRTMIDKVKERLVTTGVATKKMADSENPDPLCLREEHITELLVISNNVDVFSINGKFKAYMPGAGKKVNDIAEEGIFPADIDAFLETHAEKASALIDASKEANAPIECCSLSAVKSLLHLQSVTNLKKFLEKNGKFIPDEIASLHSVDVEYEHLLAGFKVSRRTRVAIARLKQYRID